VEPEGITLGRLPFEIIYLLLDHFRQRSVSKVLDRGLKFLPVGQKENNWTTTTKADASSALLHALMVFFWAAGSNFCWARSRGRCGSSHLDRYGPAITSHHRWRNLVDGNGPSPVIPLTEQSSNESNLNLLSSEVACLL